MMSTKAPGHDACIDYEISVGTSRMNFDFAAVEGIEASWSLYFPITTDQVTASVIPCFVDVSIQFSVFLINVTASTPTTLRV